MIINNRWFGVLNSKNIHGVASVIREILVGKHIAIASADYCDSTNAQVRLIADCQLDSRWTSQPEAEPVRVFEAEGTGSSWIGFSAGHSRWSFHARSDEGQDHEDYHYPYFSFNGDQFTVIQRAPAGKGYLQGYLHKNTFGAHQ